MHRLRGATAPLAEYAKLVEFAELKSRLTREQQI
jgi:hypothetical protein